MVLQIEEKVLARLETLVSGVTSVNPDNNTLHPALFELGCSLNTGADAPEFPNIPHPSEESESLFQLGSDLLELADWALTPELRRYAEHYKQSSTTRRALICQRVLSLINSQFSKPWVVGRKGNWERALKYLPRRYRFPVPDHLDQPFGRILPSRFGKRDGEVFPNCVGKTMLVHAWARLAGANPVSAIHVRSVHDSYLRCLTNSLRKIMESGVEFPKGVKGWMMSLFDDLALTTSDADRVHVGALIEIEEGVWIMLDPHAHISTGVQLVWNLPANIERFRYFSQLFPGLGLTVGSSTGDEVKVFQPYLDLIHRQFEHVTWPMHQLMEGEEPKETSDPEIDDYRIARQRIALLDQLGLDDEERRLAAGESLGRSCYDLFHKSREAHGLTPPAVELMVPEMAFAMAAVSDFGMEYQHPNTEILLRRNYFEQYRLLYENSQRDNEEDDPILNQVEKFPAYMRSFEMAFLWKRQIRPALKQMEQICDEMES